MESKLRSASRGHRLPLSALVLLPILLTGCSTLPAYKQGLLSKKNMSFDEKTGDSMSIGIISQIETGSDSSAGGQSAGCIACR